MSAVMTNLAGELPAPPPHATRPGVWTIRPDQALRWAQISAQSAPVPAPVVHSSVGPARAVGIVIAVALAAVLGGVAAWWLSG